VAARRAVSTPDSGRYVGDAACASCHADVAAAYRSTGHGQSVSAFDSSTVPEQLSDPPTVHHENSNLSYEPFVRDGALYQWEFRRGPEGDTVHQRVHRVGLVIGSGNATLGIIFLQRNRPAASIKNAPLRRRPEGGVRVAEWAALPTRDRPRGVGGAWGPAESNYFRCVSGRRSAAYWARARFVISATRSESSRSICASRPRIAGSVPME